MVAFVEDLLNYFQSTFSLRDCCRSVLVLRKLSRYLEFLFVAKGKHHLGERIYPDVWLCRLIDR